jgi:hypothetical protein
MVQIVKLDGATFDFERAHLKLQIAIKSIKKPLSASHSKGN